MSRRLGACHDGVHGRHVNIEGTLPQTDIWSLGCVLYEVLTQRHAFEVASMKALLAKIVAGRYAPVSPSYSR